MLFHPGILALLSESARHLDKTTDEAEYLGSRYRTFVALTSPMGEQLKKYFPDIWKVERQSTVQIDWFSDKTNATC